MSSNNLPGTPMEISSIPIWEDHPFTILQHLEIRRAGNTIIFISGDHHITTHNKTTFTHSDLLKIKDSLHQANNQPSS